MDTDFALIRLGAEARRSAGFAFRRSAPLTPWRGAYAREWLNARCLVAFDHARHKARFALTSL